MKRRETSSLIRHNLPEGCMHCMPCLSLYLPTPVETNTLSLILQFAFGKKFYMPCNLVPSLLLQSVP